MSISYKAVGWNRQKRIYDFTLLGILLLAISAFATATAIWRPSTTAETFIIRFTSVSAFLLLHVILAIGPLARLDRRFLPLLYNRRHLGVTMAGLALIHAIFAIVQFHAFGDANPIASVFTAYDSEYTLPRSSAAFTRFPFEVFGFAALLILLLMAATSHDFWLHNLGASIWKGLHLLVYLAYFLILTHVLLGVVQSERNPLYPILLGLGFLVILVLHALAWRLEKGKDRHRVELAKDGFIAVANVSELKPEAGLVVNAAGHRYALFVRDGRLFALSNVCRHQGGPIGEGKVMNGCITCPWHGYQYRADDGCSPPPFSEVLPTYPVRVEDGIVYLKPSALPLKTQSAGVPVDVTGSTEPQPFYIGWQSKCSPLIAKIPRRSIVGLAMVIPLITVGIVWSQNQVDRGGFEFGTVKTFEGILIEKPIPRLHDPKSGFGYVLVGAGKFGPPKVIKGADGKWVKFSGSLIAREPMRMIEMNAPESFSVMDAREVAAPKRSQLGSGVYVGELVDTKCYFGVMRPAAGKVHRACAIRCLSGGVPPGLLMRDASGDGVVFLLAGMDERPLEYDVQLAGTEIQVEGNLELENSVPILRVRSLKPRR